LLVVVEVVNTGQEVAEQEDIVALFQVKFLVVEHLQKVQLL
jgi:hypothetical protein